MNGRSTAPATPEVSVLYANYNAAGFLEASLRSILDQTLGAVEVLFVDDVSTDDGVAIAERISAADPRVRVTRMAANGGPAAARNRALDWARGRFVAVVDSDDVIHPSRFERLVAEADATGADMVADDQFVYVDGVDAPPVRFLKAADRGAPFALGLDEYLRRSVLYGPEPAPGFLKPIIRRHALLASEVRYDESLRISEDDDFVARLLLAGLRYQVTPQPLYYYRKHAGSISHRLTVAAIEAMRFADERLAANVVARRPDLAPRMRVRARALANVAAFEHALAAAKARRPLQATAALLRRPGALPLLRMPLGAAARRLFPRPLPPAITPERQIAELHAAADAALP